MQFQVFFLLLEFYFATTEQKVNHARGLLRLEQKPTAFNQKLLFRASFPSPAHLCCSPVKFLRYPPHFQTKVAKRESQMQSMCTREKPVLSHFPLSFLLFLLEALCHEVDGTRTKKAKLSINCVFSGANLCLQTPLKMLLKINTSGA